MLQHVHGESDEAQWQPWWEKRIAKCHSRRRFWVPLSKMIWKWQKYTQYPLGNAALNYVTPTVSYSRSWLMKYNQDNSCKLKKLKRLSFKETFPCFKKSVKSLLIPQKEYHIMLLPRKSRSSKKDGRYAASELAVRHLSRKVCWYPLWWPALSDPNNWPLQHNKHNMSMNARDLGHLNRKT